MSVTEEHHREQDLAGETGFREPVAHRTYLGDAWHRFRRDRAALVGGVLVIVLALIAVLAPRIARYEPTQQFADGLSADGLPLPGSGKFWLGTDSVGRDVYSRLVWGGRVSLVVGGLANILATALGLVVGAVAGYRGGWVETILMRITDTMLGFPVLLFAIALGSVLKPGAGVVVVVIGVLYWAPMARVAYGEVLSLKTKEYVMAARSIGATDLRILVRHLVPHLIPVVVVYFSLGVSSAVMTEATLSFLGVGVPAPTPSWGNMVARGQAFYRTAPWLTLYPGFCIMLTVLGFNLVGDGLRDALDPYVRGE